MGSRWKPANGIAVCSAVLSMMVLSGCQRVEAPTKPGAQADPMRSAMHTQTLAQQGLLHVDSRTASEIERATGLKWAVVLQEGQKAYVGVFPNSLSSPAPGSAPRTRYTGPPLWDTKSALAKQSPEQWMRALREWHPRADTYDNRPKDRSGRMSPQQQAQIRNIVKSRFPNVQTVLITSDTASASMLRGYADYVVAGGDMTRYMSDFHRRVNQIWPKGRGVAPDRPSAAPDFGTIGTPADERTPAHGPVRS